MPRDLLTLPDLLADLTQRYGPRPAVVCGADELTFAELEVRSGRWAAALAAAAIGRGRHVGLLAANGIDWVAIAFGVWRAGATLVPISTFATPREIEEIIDHADIDLLITQSSLRSHDYLAALAAIATPRLERVVVLGEAPATHLSAREFLASASAVTSPAVDPNTIACILYTSGTTGRAKGVRLSHGAILSTVLPTAERTGLGPGDSMISTLPLFWVAGLVIRALPTWSTGCGLLFIDTFTPEGVLELIEQRRPTALHLRPPQVAEILRHPRFSEGMLAGIHRGNGRADWFEGHLPADARFITGYGMTEMAGYVTALDWRDDDEARRSGMGTPLPGVEMRIVDAGGAQLPAGQTGEIRVRGPGMFAGYHKEPPAMGRDDDGWFVTGDLGSIDASGTFRFIGRSKDLLRVKGINVSPVEVEQVLARHPAVEAAYVVGLPADGLEQSVVGIIVARGTTSALEEELRRLSREQLSHYKRPHAFVFLRADEVPFGATSKPQRATLAAIAAGRLGIGSTD